MIMRSYRVRLSPTPCTTLRPSAVFPQTKLSNLFEFSRGESPRGIGSPSIFPEILEARRTQLGVPHGVLNVLVAEVELDRARVLAGVRQVETARVPKHVS